MVDEQVVDDLVHVEVLARLLNLLPLERWIFLFKLVGSISLLTKRLLINKGLDLVEVEANLLLQELLWLWRKRVGDLLECVLANLIDRLLAN